MSFPAATCTFFTDVCFKRRTSKEDWFYSCHAFMWFQSEWLIKCCSAASFCSRMCFTSFICALRSETVWEDIQLHRLNDSLGRFWTMQQVENHKSDCRTFFFNMYVYLLVIMKLFRSRWNNDTPLSRIYRLHKELEAKNTVTALWNRQRTFINRKEKSQNAFFFIVI